MILEAALLRRPFLFVCDVERGATNALLPSPRRLTEHWGQSRHRLPACYLTTGTFLADVENSLELCGLAEAIPSTGGIPPTREDRRQIQSAAALGAGRADTVFNLICQP